MSNISKKQVVENQYKTSDNLNARISIHDKYSTNKIGFGNWIISNYDIPIDADVLELGCGTGSMWMTGLSLLKGNVHLTLTDFSEGMVNSAKELLGENERISFDVVNIESIPYESSRFNRVIANMMLYHVPNLDKGLSEVARVLSDNGYFYCATYGENGIVPYLTKLLTDSKMDFSNKNFTLQNGSNILSRYFTEVKRLDYIDSLAVTDLDDIIDYIYTLSSMSEITKLERDYIKNVLENNMVNGVLNIPKEYGMFICKK